MSLPKTDIRLLAWHDVPAAIGLLTRLPVPMPQNVALRGAQAAWAYPLAGALLGALVAAIATAATAAGLAPALAAGVALALQMMATGGLHEDGLADCADGFWGGWTRERRLEIMKDSHIGTYGVLALLCVGGLRWAALAVLLGIGLAPATLAAALVASAMASRAVIPVLMVALPNARGSGLSASVGQPRRATAFLAVLLAGLAAVGLMGPGTALWVLGGSAVGAGAVAWLARAKIGGQTGDVLGASQQISEMCIMLSLSAVLAG